MSPADYYNQQQKDQRGNTQNVLNMIMTMKQFKMNQEEKKRTETLEAGRYADEQNRLHQQMGRQAKLDELAMRKGEADIKYTGALTKKAQRPLKPTIPEQRQAYADFLYKNEELSGDEYQQFSLTGTLPTKKLTPYQEYSKTSTSMGRSQSYVRNKISDYNRTIAKLNEPMSQTELIGRLATDSFEGADLSVDKEGIKNLESASGVLARLEMIAQDRQWTPGEKKLMTYIAGNRENIRKNGLEMQAAEVNGVRTGEVRIKINGQWVEIK